jgi:hypothetical protein
MPIAVWFTADRVNVALERSAPWCHTCCMDLAIKA